MIDVISLNDLIRQYRKPLADVPIYAGLPERRRAGMICAAEVRHSRDDFWHIAHNLRVYNAFDQHEDSTAYEVVQSPHERAAGRVLNWLNHLQAEEYELCMAIGRRNVRRDYLRFLFKRRFNIKVGFRKAWAEYQSLRAEVKP